MIYVVMSDGRLVVPSTIDIEYYPHKRIEFTIDKEAYMYRDCYEDSEYEVIHDNIRIHVPRTSFKVFKYGQWFYTENVDCILITNPEEDKELNYLETTDFNAGVLYNRVEKAVYPALKDNSIDSTVGTLSLPAIQVLPKITFQITSEEDIINAITKKITEHFDAVYGKTFSIAFPTFRKAKANVELDYVITRKHQYKEMTVAEIESALGYKIKVVSDK